MTIDQFKTICTLAETLTDIQFGTITKQEMLDWCEEFFRECDNEDDHFYAILKDGRFADKELEPCKKSELRTAYKITYTFPGGTLWFPMNDQIDEYFDAYEELNAAYQALRDAEYRFMEEDF